MATIKVTCGIIFNDEDKVFLCRRKPEKSMGGYWEFPGGKVEEGESYEECLKRELFEELDMDVRVNDHFITVQHDYGTFEIELIAFICHFQTSSFVLMDHDRYGWVKISNLLDKELAPADVPIWNSLIARFC
ncbi:(deoxy)nucleoside triphosphate pyrophosphohydrolase [Vibrio alginolyticus]|uniref:(deoxy)nucleoside triphosphate pyrophosphohydrolase n=1 Tax=Vibrio alginolyticus TaxID=663 RepID=UPI001BD2C96A|nr:(deoxy)nucleoside triphosphate pyrophosphohydrolase [Vibrio alginolyticus]MBT0094272.1 (deoxy)nucleoside triphosphate pyrophosphohydrolase [Vibrio alginolyticus]